MPDNTRLGAWMLCLLLCALAGLASMRQQAARAWQPQPVAARDAQPWMADCLPGIGPSKREAAADAIRSGKLYVLPARSRLAALQMFAWDGVDIALRLPGK